MILLRKINISTGEFVEDVTYTHTFTDGVQDTMPDYLIEEPVPIGFMNPAYVNGSWVDLEPQSDNDVRVSANKIQELNNAVEGMLSDLVASKGYTSRLNYSKYVGYPNEFRLDAENLGAYESSVWAYVEAELEKFKSGTRALPTVGELLSELPLFTEL